MYPTGPGLFHEEGAPSVAPSAGAVGIVADSYEQAMEYVLAAPMSSPYYVILTVADVEGRQLGGLALLAQRPLSVELKTALIRACGISA